jgi:DNA (cytosine-5)-methyltransferase 1
MKYATVCSGIEAPSVAWHPLGWEPVFFSEIEPFPCAVLKHHYPAVPNRGDMTRFKEWPDATFDVLCGGTPCQSFSVAGLRKGLDDPRGNLTLVFLAVVDRFRPEWVVWENVPGILSSDGGRAFGAFLGGLGQLGYGFAYRVLDAQYFGVPQRRRRVFVVGHLGDWRAAAAVLFERHCLQGHPAPRREAREGIAPTISARTEGGGGLGTDFDCDGGLVASHDIAQPLRAGRQFSDMGDGQSNVVAHSLRANGFDASEDGTGRGTPLVPDVCPALKSRDYKGPSSDGDGDGAILVPVAYGIDEEQNAAEELMGTLKARTDGGGFEAAVAFAQNQRDEVREMEVAGALAGEPGMKQQTYLQQAMQVRRLTPRECERLQGFPDDYTLIQYRGKPAADGPRYKALGNSMAVPVVRWIGERIEQVSNIA